MKLYICTSSSTTHQKGQGETPRRVVACFFLLLAAKTHNNIQIYFLTVRQSLLQILLLCGMFRHCFSSTKLRSRLRPVANFEPPE